jgi:hypothetical protein
VFLYAVSRIRKHNKVLAEWLVVAQGWGNGIVVGSLTLTMMINATPHWPMFVAALGVTVAIFAYIKRDRLFARPEMRE